MIQRTRRGAGFAGLALLCGAQVGAEPGIEVAGGVGAEPRPAELAARRETAVVLEFASGERAERPVAELERGWLAGADGALALRLPAASSPPLRSEDDDAKAAITLVGGDRVVARIAGGHEETLEVELAGNVPLPIYIDDLESFAFPGRVPAGNALEPPARGDRLYWVRPTSLDVVDGAFQSFTPSGVSFLGAQLGVVKEFPWNEVAGLFLELFEQPAAEQGVGGQQAVVIDLIDGSRLRGSLAELGRDGALLELAAGQSVALPLAVVVEIARDDGSFLYLSDRPPSSASQVSPFGDDFGLRWPYRVDRSTSGGPLVASGTHYTRGLGVHAPSVLTWELDGDWSELRGAVALDDEVLKLPGRSDASVEFRVWLDGGPTEGGEPAWTSGVMRAGDPPLAIGSQRSGVSAGLPLEGARSLTLEVDMADRLFIGDRADWLRIRLVR